MRTANTVTLLFATSLPPCSVVGIKDGVLSMAVAPYQNPVSAVLLRRYDKAGSRLKANHGRADPRFSPREKT